MRRIALIAMLSLALASCGKRSTKLSDDDIKSMVDRLFTAPDGRGDNYRALYAVADRAAPYLVRALDDPRAWNIRPNRNNPKFWLEAPFERIAGLLRKTAPAAAAKPLRRYVDHPDSWFRGNAGLVLAKIGTVECVEPVKKALADREDRVREFTLGGLVEGMQSGRRNPDFLMPVFDAVTPTLKDQHRYDWQGPASVLAWIDMPKAAAILETPEFFTTGNPQLEDVLKALGMSGHKTPLAILKPLMQELAPAAETNYRRACEFAAALRLYAHNPDADAEASLRALLNSPEDRVATGAGYALEDLAGVDTESVIKLGDNGRLADMTPRQRYYYAVSEYHYEVCNGGHDQFFRNPSGDLYPYVLEGLRAMGARTKADIFEGALHAFGTFTKPALDQGARQEQVATLIPAARALLDRADQAYYDSEKRPGERIEVLMSLYAVANRKDF
jgi:HEAT repeat protein